jgi:hypothetical protein
MDEATFHVLVKQPLQCKYARTQIHSHSFIPSNLDQCGAVSRCKNTSNASAATMFALEVYLSFAQLAQSEWLIC